MKNSIQFDHLIRYLNNKFNTYFANIHDRKNSEDSFLYNNSYNNIVHLMNGLSNLYQYHTFYIFANILY